MTNSTRGGAREGAGRKTSKHGKRVKVSHYVHPNVAKYLEAQANKAQAIDQAFAIAFGVDVS